MGVIPVLESYLGLAEFQPDALDVCALLLKVPSALAKLREAGFVPAVTRASHCAAELGRWVRNHCRTSDLVEEFVDAGLLGKLEEDMSRMVGQPAEQREVAALIDELARIASRQPAKQLEAFSGALARVSGKALARVSGKGSPAARAVRSLTSRSDHVTWSPSEFRSRFPCIIIPSPDALCIHYFPQSDQLCVH